MDSDVTKKVDTRLATIEGHIKAVRKMLEEQKECVEIIQQLLAIEHALKKTGFVILKHHMDVCIKDAVKNQNYDEIQNLNKIIEMYL